MGQITLRLPDEQERYLKNLAEKNDKTLAQYARELLDLGAQVEIASHESVKPTEIINNQSASLQTLYLVRYMVKRIFKEEGIQASKIASEKAKEEIN